MTDEQDVIERLQKYETQLNELMTIVEKHPLRAGPKENARQLLKCLKEDFDAECRKGETIRGEAELTDFEKRFLMPAVRGARSQIRVRWNSAPNAHWFTELYGARIDITHALFELKKSRSDTKDEGARE